MKRVNKLKYIFKRIAAMDFKNMIAQAKVVRSRTRRPVVFTLVDMIYCGFKYLAGYMDYVVFEFYRLSAAQRATQVTRGINNELVKTLNKKEHWYKFDKKDEFNRIFSDFLKRDWLDIENSTLGEFEQFCEKYPQMIVKPRDGACQRTGYKRHQHRKPHRRTANQHHCADAAAGTDRAIH